jgi:hypothetical protein
MIAAKPGIVARFRDKARASTFERDVVAWGDDGEPLIMGDRGLKVASAMSNFTGLGESSSGQIVSMIPASDWLVWRVEDGRPWSARLCAWGLKPDGTVVPLEPDSEGLVLETEDGIIRHVSEGPPPAASAHAPAVDGGDIPWPDSAELDEINRRNIEDARSEREEATTAGPES